MKFELERLIRLQAIDTQISQASGTISDHPQQLENARGPLQAAQNEIEKARKAVESASAHKRDKEGDLQTQEDKISKLKSRQSDIKTNKEYHALLLEIETAQKVIGIIEDELLNLMEVLEIENKKVLDQDTLVEEVEKIYQAKEAELAKESAVLNEATSKLKEKREETCKGLEESLLSQYEKLRSMRKDLAVVPIIGESCGGCHMNIPPQLVAEVKTDESILSCSYCFRILYSQQSLDHPQTPGETNSLGPLPHSS